MSDPRKSKCTFTWSCAAALNLRHNLNIPTGPGGLRQVGYKLLFGCGHMTSCAANTMVFTSQSATGSFDLVMPDGVTYGSYPTGP